MTNDTGTKSVRQLMDIIKSRKCAREPRSLSFPSSSSSSLRRREGEGKEKGWNSYNHTHTTQCFPFTGIKASGLYCISVIYKRVTTLFVILLHGIGPRG